MARLKKTWREKLADSKDLPKVVEISDNRGELNQKYPGGLEAQAAHLKKEGHIIELGRNEKPRKVRDFEKALVEV